MSAALDSRPALAPVPLADARASADLRAAVKAEMAQLGIKLPEVARQSGVGYSTLSAWMNDSYTGDNERVARDVQRWLDSLSAQARARALDRVAPGFVHTPSSEAFIAALEHAQYTADLVVVCGEAGVGKTMACEEYERTHPNVWLLTAEPSFASTRAMLGELCEVIGVTEPVATRRSRSIISRVRGSSGLLVVDEAQHLTVLAIEQLRAIHDKAHIGFALVGNPGVYAQLLGDARGNLTAQLSSRVGLRLQRKGPRAEDIDAILDAWGIQGDGRKLLRAVAHKPGALRGMVKTLRLARAIAVHCGTEEIEPRHVEAAWLQLSDTPLPAGRD